jgi:hypothetical protein
MTTPLTILAMPKAFHGHIGLIQRNAIASWTQLRPRPEIHLFGEDEGVAEIAAELRIHHLRDIARSEFGTPLLDDLLRRAREFAGTPLLCYVNSDIILLQEFLDSVTKIQAQLTNFLVVAHRLNINVAEIIDFAADGERKLRSEILPRGLPGNHTAIDAFVFPRDMYTQVPPLAIGRAWFDQWLIQDARRQDVPVVDVTEVARAIHQNHEYGHIAGGQQGAYWGEEARRNLAIYGGVPHAFTLLEVTHELKRDGRLRRVHFLRERHAAREWLWRTFVLRTASVRERLGLRRGALKEIAGKDTVAKT